MSQEQQALNKELDKTTQMNLKESESTKAIEDELNRTSIADGINKIALAKHYILNKPLDALTMHLEALKINLECVIQLMRSKSHTNDILDYSLNRRRKILLSSDVVVTLTDMGNCFWSMGNLDKSKIMYHGALSIYFLMNINTKFIAASIYNRLSKLDPYGNLVDVHHRISKISSRDPERCTIDSPCCKIVEIMKDMVLVCDVKSDIRDVASIAEKIRHELYEL